MAANFRNSDRRLVAVGYAVQHQMGRPPDTSAKGLAARAQNRTDGRIPWVVDQIWVSQMLFHQMVGQRESRRCVDADLSRTNGTFHYPPPKSCCCSKQRRQELSPAPDQALHSELRCHSTTEQSAELRSLGYTWFIPPLGCVLSIIA